MKNLDEAKKDILSYSQSLFARYGFDKTTLKEITSGYGRCKSSIYYHFKNKEDIFGEVVGMEFENIRKELSGILTHRNEDPASTFAEYIRRRIELLDRAVVYGNAMKSGSQMSRLLVGRARESFDRWEREFFDSVWSGITGAGIIPMTISREAFSNTLFGLLKGIEAQYFSTDDKASVRELCSTMTELLIHRNPNFSIASK